MSMTKRNPFPRHSGKSKLKPQGKAIAAAMALLDVMDDKIDEKQLGRRLKEEVGLQWSWLNCIQYLSGKEAVNALFDLPNDWSEGGRNKLELLAAAFTAAHTVANVRSDGTPLCASDLAKGMAGIEMEDWIKLRLAEQTGRAH